MQTFTEHVKEGQKVEGNYQGRGKWYPGVVERVWSNGSMDVLYDDGEVHEVNLLDSNELYMIGRGCYVVKMPGHSPGIAAAGSRSYHPDSPPFRAQENLR